MYVFVFFSRACCFPMQVNKTLTNLNLEYNKLGPQGGKAIAQSLEVTFHVQCHTLSTCRFVTFHCHTLSIGLSMTANITSLLCMHFFVQVNTSITELNLIDNKLDAEAGKALGKALEVSPIFIVIALSLHDADFYLSRVDEYHFDIAEP
jgi:hypothetical protein